MNDFATKTNAYYQRHLVYATKFIRCFFAISTLLILHGYFCRITGIYFFWESKTIGWTLIFLASILFLLSKIKYKKRQNAKVLSERIFIGLITFILIVRCLIFFATPATGTYNAAQKFLIANPQVKEELGDINGFFLMPVGSFAMSSSSEGSSGEAELNIIVKGSKKYKDIKVYLLKSIETDWVAQIEN